MGGWTTTDDPRAFFDAAGAYLHAHPVENTVLLSVGDRLARSGAAADGARFGWWTDTEIAGAFMHTPPYKVLVAAPREAARELGRALRGTGVDGVNADADVAAAFADGFGARERRVHQRHRLHRLTTLVPPDPPPPGRARTATTGDAALLERWTVAFGAEAGDVVHDVPTLVADRLSFSGFMLWEDEGEPVSYAAANRQLANAVRIGPVYTPPEQRRRGYAAGATAAAAAAALAGGATEVLLFTDLANPTSNALYQRLGFEGLVDRVLLEFA